MIDIKVISDSKLQALVTGVGFFTYILIGQEGRYYTGLTGDLMKRMEQHDRGKSISTRNMLPVKMIYVIVSKTRSEARRLEVKIKNRSALRYLQGRKFNKMGLEVTEWMDVEGYNQVILEV